MVAKDASTDLSLRGVKYLLLLGYLTVGFCEVPLKEGWADFFRQNEELVELKD